MAGIGFKLRKMTEEGGLLGFFGGYATAAAIMAGPWIITVLTVGAMSFFGQSLDRLSLYLTHIYPISLIVVGFIQFPATRYLSDLLYVGNYKDVFPALNATLLTGNFVSSILALIWGLTTPDVSWAQKFGVLGLANIVTMQWIALIFLVTIHRYFSIIGAFFLGGVVSFTVGLELNYSIGTTGALFGFSLGQLITVIVLLISLMREYPAETRWDFGYVQWIKRSPALSLAGGLFYLGSFADKIVFRYGGFLTDAPGTGKLMLAPWLYMSHPYETITFLAQLTIIPALAIFYIRLETGFFEVYKAFYNTIDDRGNLEQLHYIKREILAQLRRGAKNIFAIQGVISILAILLAAEIFPWVSNNELQDNLLRVSILASFFGIFVLLTIVIFLYFEFYNEACWAAASYLTLNTLLTVVGLYLPEKYYGLGAVLAGILGSAWSARLLAQRVDDLLYQTFSKSPVESLPSRPNELQGVGRFHFNKEGTS